jgi:ferredoxin-NADP reductase
VALTLPIREVVRATPRARIVRLGLDHQRFDYVAGQAVVVGTHGSGERRPYSIAAAPEDARRDRWLELLVGVDGDGRAGSHLSLAAGTPVDVEGPVGTFTFPASPEERQFLFIAGGTGIAPLRAMLRHVLATLNGRGDAAARTDRAPATRPGLLYSARTPDEFAYEDEFRALARTGRIDLRQTITRAGEFDWSGARGRIDRTALSALVHSPATLCFVCGPPPLVAEMTKLLEELSVPASRVRTETWL